MLNMGPIESNNVTTIFFSKEFLDINLNGLNILSNLKILSPAVLTLIKSMSIKLVDTIKKSKIFQNPLK